MLKLIPDLGFVIHCHPLSASLGWGKSCIRFWGRLFENCGYHGNRNCPLAHNGKNSVSKFFFSHLKSNLCQTFAVIKSPMSSTLGWVGLLTTVIHPWAFLLTLNQENGVSIFSQLLANSVFIKLAENNDRHKISHEFEFWTYLTYHWSFMALISEKKNDVSSFSQLPLIGSLSNLQVMKTGIKAWTSSNLGWIRLFTSELFTLEHRFFPPYRLILKKMKFLLEKGRTMDFETSNRWPKWQNVSVYNKTLSPGGCLCPLPLGYVHVLNLIMKYFLWSFSPFHWFKRAVVSFWRKNVHNTG